MANLAPAVPDMAGMRQCNGTCGEWKPLTAANFFLDADGPGGFSRKCRDCDAAYQRARRQRIKAGQHVVKPNRRGRGNK